MRCLVIACLAWAFATVPASTWAQSQSAKQVLSVLMTNQDVQTGDFARDRQAAEATRDTVARALLVDLATLPITTSSGGFSYRLNPSLGTVERVNESFGPFFVDRATTAGRNQASVSFTYQHSNLVELDGRNLNDGSLQITANRFRDESAPFDVASLALRLQTSTVTGSLNYGLTDSVDLGMTVPLVSLRMSGQLIDTYRGVSVVQAKGDATAFGVADIAFRSKLQLVHARTGGLAAVLEARLPTGDPDNFRGAGKAGYRIGLVGSAGHGPVEAHVNGSLAFGGISRDENMSAAVVVAPASRLTLSGELLFRRVDQLAPIRSVSVPHPSIVGVDTIRLLPDTLGVTTSSLVGGMRINLTSTVLLNAYLAVPIADRGLTARVTPSISLDYSFVH